MPPRYLATTSLAELTPMVSGGQTMIVENRCLTDALAQGDAKLASAFAEPVVSGTDDQGRRRNVAWYGVVVADARPITELTGEEKGAADAALQQVLAALRPLISDPSVGPVIARALVLPGLDSIWAGESGITITNWSLLPEEVDPQDADAIADHIVSVFGDHWEGSTAGLRHALREGGFSEAPDSREVRSERLPSTPPLPLSAGHPILSNQPWWRRAWFISFLALLFLFAGLIVGSLLFGDRLLEARTRTDPLAAKQHQKVIKGLRERRDALRDILADDKAICAEISADAVARPPQMLPTPDGASSGSSSSSARNLANYLEQGTVLVFAVPPGGERVSSGSGFLISPRHVVTNHHVVEEALSGGSFLVTNKTIGGMRAGRVVATSSGHAKGQRDYAVIELEQPLGNPVLRLTDQAAKMDEIISVGFPGAIMDWDEGFERLLEGNTGAAPSATLAPGAIINLVSPQGVPLVFHSARVSGGNSGGPLVDRCGRVVGINTLADPAAQIQIALAAPDLRNFLHENRIEHPFDTDPCNPIATPGTTEE